MREAIQEVAIVEQYCINFPNQRLRKATSEIPASTTTMKTTLSHLVFRAYKNGLKRCIECC